MRFGIRMNRWGIGQENEFLGWSRFVLDPAAAQILRPRLCNEFSNSVLNPSSSSSRRNEFSLSDFEKSDHSVKTSDALVMLQYKSGGQLHLAKPLADKRFAFHSATSHGEAFRLIAAFPRTTTGRFDVEAFLRFVSRSVVVRAQGVPTPAELQECKEDPHNVPQNFVPHCTGDGTACQLGACAHIALYMRKNGLYESDSPLKQPRKKKKLELAAPDALPSDFSGRAALGPVQNQFLDNIEICRDYDWQDDKSYDGKGGISQFFGAVSEAAVSFLNKLKDGDAGSESAGGKPALKLVINFFKEVGVRSKKQTMVQKAEDLEEKARATFNAVFDAPEPLAIEF